MDTDHKNMNHGNLFWQIEMIGFLALLRYSFHNEDLRTVHCLPGYWHCI